MKANYRLSVEAKADLTRIYRYGFETYGEARADQYFRDLIERFELLAQQPKMYPAADEVGEGIRKSVCGRDTIYYEIVGQQVVVQFILGRQDVKLRIKHWQL